MAFTVVQVGDQLRLMNESGEYSTPLTLPTGIILRTNVPPRWHIFDGYTVLVNTPDQPLTIDGNGVVRLLTPRPPSLAPTLSSVAGGSLSGTYSGVRYTFVVLDADGNIIAESDYSPASNSVTFTTDFLKAAGLDTSIDDITLRRLYRGTDGSSTPLFQWIDLDGNVLTEIQDDLADAALSLVAAPVLGTPPYLSLISSFRGRLFGAGPEDLDHVRFTEAGIRYAWPADNILEIPVRGSDQIGITAFLKRRETLGVARRNRLESIVGDGAENVTAGTINFDVVNISEVLGVISQESVVVRKDIAHFLWEDGVYEWGSDGVKCVSDGENRIGNVRSWFATDDYFDRSRFSEAFAHYDHDRNKYRLFLFDPDGNLRWVEFDTKNRTWWGPHKTGAFIPKSAFTVQVGERQIPMIGGTNAHVYQEQTTRTDSTATAIEMAVISKRHDLELPNHTKFFGRVALFGRGASTGRVIVKARVGSLERTLASQQYYNINNSRQRLGRLGVGHHCQVELQHATAGEKVDLFGYDMEDVHVVGLR